VTTGHKFTVTGAATFSRTQAGALAAISDSSAQAITDSSLLPWSARTIGER
jgi:hypothetical protein